MRLLIVEDSARLRASLQAGLTKGGFSVDVAADGEAAVGLLRVNPFDLVVLDIGLPGRDGLAVLRELRGEGNDVPVLLLTARDATDEVVAGFEAGADDYLVKPFEFDELLVRCRALLRRRFGTPHRVVAVGDLELDTTSRTVSVGGERISLTARDYKLLEALALRVGDVVSREALEDHVYRLDHLPSSNAIDAAVYALRRKIDRGGGPSHIQTVRGLGYTLRVDSPTGSEHDAPSTGEPE